MAQIVAKKRKMRATSRKFLWDWAFPGEGRFDFAPFSGLFYGAVLLVFGENRSLFLPTGGFEARDISRLQRFQKQPQIPRLPSLRYVRSG
jgi:hypothetical protein